MTWQNIRISRFGGPAVLELAEQSTIPDPGPGEVRIKVLAAGTGFTDSFIRRGRYPDFKGPLPFTPGYDLVGVIDKTGPGVTAPREGELVADLCVVGGYAQYAIRPARFLVPVPVGLDPAEAVCIPLAYLTAFQMLTRVCQLSPGATILVIGASGSILYQATAPAPVSPVAAPGGGFIVMVASQVGFLGPDMAWKPLMDVGQALGRSR